VHRLAEVALVVQQVDNDVLAPVIYGKSLKLHPLVILLGIAAGNALYGGREKQTARPGPQPPSTRPLAFLGRHSLPVYLIHQPILLAALILLGVGDAGIP